MDNKKSIEKIPKIRQEIIDAINQNKLVLFIGAGVSAGAGLIMLASNSASGLK